MLTLLVLSSIYLAAGEVYFKENFNADWKKNWVHSKSSNYAKFVWSPGWWYVDSSDNGLITLNLTTNYAISSKFPSFSSNSKPLIIQYTLRNHQKIECSGAYIKILNNRFDPKSFNNETPYLIMFGPDICDNVYKCHIILPYNNKNWSITRLIDVPKDRLTHQYTLIINPDFSVVYLLDNEEVFRGSLKEDFGIEGVLEEKYEIDDIGGVGIEILQTSTGSLFDNFLVTDSIEEAKKVSEETFEWKIELEKQKLQEFDDKQEQMRLDYNKANENMFKNGHEFGEQDDIEGIQKDLEKKIKNMGPGKHYF